MRRFILPGTFLLLVAGIYFLWQHRFERSPGFSTIRLADLRTTARPAPGVDWVGSESEPKLRLRVDPANPRSAVIRFDLPGIQAVDLLHIRFQISAHDLTQGRQVWDDGRCIVEWHSLSAGAPREVSQIGSARGNSARAVHEWVARPDLPPAIPALRVEHLGTSGDFLLSEFEATVVRERMIWKIGRWILMAAWLAWAVAWIGGSFRRALPAAAIWLVMGIFFVIPGPWKLYHSLGAPFQIGQEITLPPAPAARPPDPPAGNPAPESPTANSPPPANPAPASPTLLESVGKIPDQGDFALRLKNYAANVRPLLHSLLLFVPTLLIACLVGRRSALSLAVILALSIEAAQIAFGYGSDRVDLFDLACDAAGIALALLAHRRLKRWSTLVR